MVGERGGSTATFEEGAELLNTFKVDWSELIRLEIKSCLMFKGEFHASDLVELGIPADHKNCVGAAVMAAVKRGVMEETGERRRSTDPAGHGRRSAVYRVTEKGRVELSRAGGDASPRPSVAASSGTAPDEATPLPRDRSAEVLASASAEPLHAGKAAAPVAPGCSGNLSPESPEPLRLFEDEQPASINREPGHIDVDQRKAA